MIRSVLAGAAIFAVFRVFAAEPQVSEILALRGADLFEAADRAEVSDFSASDLIKITEKLASERKKIVKDDLHEFALAKLFEAACDKANTTELDKLIQIYISFPVEGFEKQFEFQPLAARWIKRELAGIKPQEIAPPTIDPPLPSELKDSPPELATAWRLFKKLTHPIEETIYFHSSKQAISFQANERAFFKTLDDVLLKRGHGHAEQLAKFGWSGWSGTGSDLVSDPRSIGILMALLTERRMPEALGAALYVRSDKPLATGDSDMRIELLRQFGVDWESALAGAEVNGELGGSFVTMYHEPYLQELCAWALTVLLFLWE